MDWVWGVVGYGVLWWMVLFSLFPWGRRSGKKRGPLLKAAVATLGAAVLWVTIYLISLSDFISIE